MLGQILTALSSIKDIINIVKKGWSVFKNWRRSSHNKEIKESVDTATEKGDQRDLEKALGSSNAGKPTKHRLLSVRRRKKKDRS